MKLIGITGKAGSGKTTFSDMLAQQHNEVGVIHVDEFFDDIKRRYFKFLMKENTHGERVNLKSNINMMIYRNKMLRSILMRVRSSLVNKSIMSKITELKNEGKTVIIVDDIFLQYQKCSNDLSIIFLIDRPFIDRRVAVMERDGVSKKDAVASDIAHTSKNYREFIHKGNIVRIKNNKGIEELHEICEQLYQEYLAPFKERQKVKQNRKEYRNIHENEVLRQQKKDKGEER